MSFDPRIRVTAGSPPTTDETKLAKRINSLAGTNLPRIRAAAERWRTGFGIGGLATALVAGFVAPDLIADLNATSKVLVFVVIGLAFTTGLISIGLALRSAIGWPTQVDTSSISQLAEWEASEQTFSVRCLRWSMILAVASAVFLAVGASIAVFGPAQVEMLEITYVDGTQRCADHISRNGDLILRDDGTSRIAISAEHIESIRPVATCVAN